MGLKIPSDFKINEIRRGFVTLFHRMNCRSAEFLRTTVSRSLDKLASALATMGHSILHLVGLVRVA
jgi:hypothetical protein